MPRTATDHRDAASSHARRLVGAELERCIVCNGTEITREGKRYKKLEVVQLWYCRTCDRVFTPLRAKGKTYPLKIVLESLMFYYRGETRARTARERAIRHCGAGAHFVRLGFRISRTYHLCAPSRRTGHALSTSSHHPRCTPASSAGVRVPHSPGKA